MPPASLIPDRQLTFSPDLAATIGLEEAILMQYLGPLLAAQSDPWCHLGYDALSQHFPFWSREKLKDLLLSLEALGGDRVIRAKREYGHSSGDGRSRRSAGKARPGEVLACRHPQAGSHRDAVYDVLQMNHGIDRQFAQQQLIDFDAGTLGHSRESRFRQHVLVAWRHQQRHHQAFEITTPPPFDQNWQPSLDALEIMTRSGGG